jgi:zinc protease
MMRRALYLTLALAAIAGDHALGQSATASRGIHNVTTEGFDVEGIHVVLRQSTLTNVVAVNLYLLGGVRQAPASLGGIEPFLLEVSDRGTAKFPKETLRHLMSRLGSEIVMAPSVDWTLFGIRATTDVLDSTWMVFSDRLMAPRLDSAEVELLRAQFLSGVSQRRDSPESLLNFLADSIAFAGHPYSLPIVGTEKSLSAITLADLRKYQQSQMVKSRMLLVVVGNVSRSHLEQLVRSTLARLPKGDYVWKAPETLPLMPATVVVSQQDLPTNYILGYYPGPLATDKDYQALRVATSVLSGRMFSEIRSRQNLTYAVHAPFLDRAATAGGLYVTTVSPDTTLKLMRAAIDELQNELLNPQGLERLVQHFLTGYFLDNETNAAQADFLARAQIYRGDFKVAERFVDELRDVTPDDIRRVARKYMKNIRFAYVGNPSQLDKDLIKMF